MYTKKFPLSYVHLISASKIQGGGVYKSETIPSQKSTFYYVLRAITPNTKLSILVQTRSLIENIKSGVSND